MNFIEMLMFVQSMFDAPATNQLLVRVDVVVALATLFILCALLLLMHMVRIIVNLFIYTKFIFRLSAVCAEPCKPSTDIWSQKHGSKI